MSGEPVESGMVELYRFSKWIPLAIVMAGLLAYTNSFSNPFVFDDRVVLVSNSGLTEWWPITPSSRVISDLTFKLNYAVGGMKVADYHLMNLLIHLVAGLLLYGVVRRTLLLPKFAGRYEQGSAWIAGAIAALWTVHPLQTESVTYICQRYESLMGLMVLLSLYGFSRAQTGGRPRLWTNVGLAACVLGMGTKEGMVVAPLLILFYDGTFVAEGWRELLRKRWRVHLAFLCSWGVLLSFYVVSEAMRISVGDGSGAGSGGDGVSPWLYLATQADVILHYAKLSFVPWPLCLDYAWPLLENWRRAILPGSILGCMAVLSVWGLIRRHPAGFLGAWFFITLAPASSILPLPDVAFEHRMYLPLAAVLTAAVMAVVGVNRVMRPSLLRGTALAVVFFVVLVAFAGLTALRNQVYSSGYLLWSDVVRQRPDNLRARNDLAIALCEQGRFEEAMVHFRYVLEKTSSVKPVLQRSGVLVAMQANSEEINRSRALANMGAMSYSRGDVTGAIQSYAEALQFCPFSSDIVSGLEHVLSASATQVGVSGVPERDVRTQALNNLGVIFEGAACPVLAERYFREALVLTPAFSEGRNNLATVLWKTGRVQEAAKEWGAVLSREAGNSKAHQGMAIVELAQKEYRISLGHLEQAIAGVPGPSSMMLDAAWVLATCPDDSVRNGPRALELARKGQDAPGVPLSRAMDVMAAAHAEVGDFALAIQTGERAVVAARAERSPGVSDMEARLAGYRKGASCRMLGSGGP